MNLVVASICSSTISNHVKVIYLSSNGKSPFISDGAAKEYNNNLEAVLKKLDKNTIYDCTLAYGQEKCFGKLLKKYGFVRVAVTKNPNTGNRIATYYRGAVQ